MNQAQRACSLASAMMLLAFIGPASAMPGPGDNEQCNNYGIHNQVNVVGDNTYSCVAQYCATAPAGAGSAGVGVGSGASEGAGNAQASAGTGCNQAAGGTVDSLKFAPPRLDSGTPRTAF